jgi:sulfoxide reductase heme-binding subunit YedZ
VRRLGPRWKELHAFVYVIAVLGIYHFYWLVKADVREPLLLAAVLFGLLLLRLPRLARRVSLIRLAGRQPAVPRISDGRAVL